jgi:hypothetical protein
LPQTPNRGQPSFKSIIEHTATQLGRHKHALIRKKEQGEKEETRRKNGKVAAPIHESPDNDVFSSALVETF